MQCGWFLLQSARFSGAFPKYFFLWNTGKIYIPAQIHGLFNENIANIEILTQFSKKKKQITKSVATVSYAKKKM